MRKVKKLLAFIVSLTMVFTMMFGTMVFAEGSATTITKDSTGNITVRDLEAGANIGAYRIIVPTFTDGRFTGYQFVDKVNTWVSTQDQYKKYANSVKNNIDALGNASKDEKDRFYSDLTAAIKSGNWDANYRLDNILGTSVSFNGVPIGQYLIIATSNNRIYRSTTADLLPTLTSNGYVVNDKCYDMKSSTVNITKTGDGQEIVQKGLGEEVEYKIKASVPTYPVGAIDTTYNISDTLSKGLQLSGNVTVKGCVSEDDPGTTLSSTADYTMTTTTDSITGETKLVLNFNYDRIKSYTKIEVTYKAKVTDKAVVGPTGNDNDAQLKYSNDPYKTDSYTTKYDKVKLYTFGVKVIKYDADTTNPRTLLPGAVFRLEKVKNNEVTEISDRPLYTTDANGEISINQLGEGSYQLVEVNAPIGYNLMDNTIPFTIFGVTVDGKYNGEVSGGTNGYLTKEVANYKTLMPSTGGTGTVIFTVSGIVLMAGAIVYLVIRKRMTSVVK